jgi:phytoene desaturase
MIRLAPSSTSERASSQTSNEVRPSGRRPGGPDPVERRARSTAQRPGTSVAVVGAGPGGLATAMLLCAAGFRVTIFEAQPIVGGRTRHIEVRGEGHGSTPGGTYRFDCGPTFFMMPYVLEEIFSATGRRLSDYAELTRLDPMYRLLIGRPNQSTLVVDTTQDLAAMAARLDAIEPTDGASFLRFIRDNRRKLELMTPVLRAPIRGLLDLMTLDGLKVLPTLKPWQSLYGLLSSYFKNEHVRLALSFQSKYLGMSPFECPSLFSILPFIEYEYGIWHPHGGCNALTKAMAAVAEEEGATIHCSSPVERLVFEGRRCTGVVVDGRTHRFDHVVLNADATWAMKHLIPQELRGGWTDEAIDAKKYSCSTFMMYLGVEGEVELPHHTIYTSTSYRKNLEDIAVTGRLSEDPSIYVCNPSRIDPSLAPTGDSALYVLVPTPNTKAAIDWNAERPRLREDAYRQLESVFGIADIRNRVRAEKLVTPADWQAERINHGATFNLAHSLSQMLHKRPQHRLQGFDGLWLVGGGTHPGSGLPVIFLSAEITTQLLCAEAGLPSPLATPPSAAAMRSNIDPALSALLAETPSRSS